MDKEQKQLERQRINAILSDATIQDAIKHQVIERYYALPHNVNGLKSELYYDLLDKFHKSKVKQAQQADIITDLESKLKFCRSQNKVSGLKKIIISLFLDKYNGCSIEEKRTLWPMFKQQYGIEFDDNFEQQ